MIIVKRGKNSLRYKTKCTVCGATLIVSPSNCISYGTHSISYAIREARHFEFTCPVCRATNTRFKGAKASPAFWSHIDIQK